MVPVRPLIKSNQGVGIRAVYYGSPKKPILIWKKGDELPIASDMVEAKFQFK